MYHDLSHEAWPEGKPVSERASYRRLLRIPRFFIPRGGGDEPLVPARLIQGVNADASQTKVMEEGKSLVVWGPPDTGKSQTITNIIAASVYDGKSVLFYRENSRLVSRT